MLFLADCCGWNAITATAILGIGVPCVVHDAVFSSVLSLRGIWHLDPQMCSLECVNGRKAVTFSVL